MAEYAIESDDDDYSGVNDVPDDDASDVEMMEQQEESFILHEEIQSTSLLSEFHDARRLSLDSFASDDIFGMNLPPRTTGVPPIPDPGFASFFSPQVVPASPDLIAKRKYSDSSTKRVRFDDEVKISDSSSSESSDLDGDLFPDLFLEQDKLPPALKQLMEFGDDDENDHSASPASDDSYWDLGQDETRTARIQQLDDADDSSTIDSSDSDADMGDTTDEEDFTIDVPPRTLNQTQSILCTPSSAAGSRAATPKPFQRSSRPNVKLIPPPRGVFIHDDSSEAIAVTSRITKKLTFYRPRPLFNNSWPPLTSYRSSISSTNNNSPNASVVQANASDSDISNEALNSIITTDIMLSGLFGLPPDNPHVFGNETVGPPEAFYPFVDVNSGVRLQVIDDEGEYDTDDFEDDVDISEFMEFGSEAGDEAEEQEGDDMDIPAPPTTPNTAFRGFSSIQSTPMTASPTSRKRSASDVMSEQLEHFDRGVVTAFRNNQIRYRDVSSLPSNPAARASVSRPVRSGKSADTLITPLRKRARSFHNMKSPHFSSPTKRNTQSPWAGVMKSSARLRNHMKSTPRDRLRRTGATV